MSSHEIKNMILNYDMTEELFGELLENDFSITITGLVNALFELLRIYSKNEEYANRLLQEIENIANMEIKTDHLKKLDSRLEDLISNIYKYLTAEQRVILYTVIGQIKDIKKMIREKKNLELSYEKVRLIEDVICNDKNLKRIRTLIRSNSDILKIKDSRGENILFKLLRKYSTMDESDKNEMDYFYQVILLFINSNYHEEILEDSSYYLEALGDSSYANVLEIKEILQNSHKQILLSDLEDKYRVYLKIPSEVEKEMYTFQTKRDHVFDLRKLECFTIDGDGALCLDDALYMKKNADGSYLLYIFITSIPTIVPYDSAINEEARKRVSSYYLFDFTATLYPEFISNYLASLLPHNDRYAEAIVFLLDPTMKIVEDQFQIIKCKIRSRYKLTYQKVDEILGSRSGTNLNNTLELLGTFALRQKKRNPKKEIYRKLENANHQDPNHESLLVDYSVAANIVHECMILYGEWKARYYKENGLPYLYRCCAPPNNRRLEEELIKIIGNDYKNLSSKDWDSFKNCIKSSYLSAQYSNIPRHHYGLDLKFYSHSSSPARRYADSFCQYIDEAFLFQPVIDDRLVYLWEYRTKEMAQYLNERIPNIEAFCNQYNYLQSKKLIRK